MKAYSLIIIFVCCIYKYTSVDIMPELKRNILNFGYRINFKYEGMLSHSFDRIYVVTKFILLIIDDLKCSPTDFNSECSYLNIDLKRHRYPMQYIPNIKKFCMEIVPFVDFHKKQIDYYNKTVHDILMKEFLCYFQIFQRTERKREV